MQQNVMSSDAIQRIAWFKIRDLAARRIYEANLHENNPPQRVPGQLFVDAGGAPSDAPTFDAWQNDPTEAGLTLRIKGSPILTMLGWSWAEAKTPGDPASRRLAETLHAQARNEWVDEAARTIADGRNGRDVEDALIYRWHAQRCKMTEHDGRPLVPSIDLLLAAPWFLSLIHI